ncbi:MAG: FHA domain-containing protein [Anaerolineae bacterium]
MVECPKCHAQHPDNTILCSECGTYLLGEDPRSTVGLDEEEITSLEPQPREAPAKQPSLTPAKITLLVQNTDREVTFALGKTILLGRLDPLANVHPDLDLTPDGGLEGGVSRRHAQLSQNSRGDVMVEDLGSINGSYLNSRPLVPNYKTRVQSGDILQLGRIFIEIIFNFE